MIKSVGVYASNSSTSIYSNLISPYRHLYLVNHSKNVIKFYFNSLFYCTIGVFDFLSNNVSGENSCSLPLYPFKNEADHRSQQLMRKTRWDELEYIEYYPQYDLINFCLYYSLKF